jgi:hypothetical protein
MKIYYNERMKVVWIGPDGPSHLPSIDIPAGTAVLPGDMVAIDALTLIEVPDTPERLAAAKAIQTARINQRREREIESGFTYGGHNWNSDDRSQLALIMRAVTIVAGTPLPSGFSWRDADNVDVPMTAAEFRSLVTELVTYAYYCFMAARALKEQVKGATTVSEVILIDVDAGWP